MENEEDGPVSISIFGSDLFQFKWVWISNGADHCLNEMCLVERVVNVCSCYEPGGAVKRTESSTLSLAVAPSTRLPNNSNVEIVPNLFSCTRPYFLAFSRLSSQKHCKTAEIGIQLHKIPLYIQLARHNAAGRELTILC